MAPRGLDLLRLPLLMLMLLMVQRSDAAQTDGGLLRTALPPMPRFGWIVDQHAADPCLEPGCYNHCKEGYFVQPINISTDATLVFQEKDRPPQYLSAMIMLDIYTQPGCIVSGCKMETYLWFFEKETCINQVGEKEPNQPDGKTVKLSFGGMYYPNLPAGEIYAKFEKKNYLTNQPTCTYEVRSGFKRWF